MKQRFSSLDIKVVAHELSKALTSLRVVNIYDLSSKIFLFKFGKPDHREQVILDSGFRIHLTSFSRTTAASPSAFVSRLRKALKTRRVTSVSQVGTDRILEIQFSDGLYRLFLEFYAGGNVILTDKELNVVALQRTVTEGAEHEHIRPGGVYNLSERQNINGVPDLTVERVKASLQKYVERQAQLSGQEQKKTKTKKKAGDELRKALVLSISEFSPMLLDHSLRTTNFDTTLSPEDILKDDAMVEKVLEALREARRTLDEITSAEKAKGYIIGKPKVIAQDGDDAKNAEQNIIYEDFHPFKPVHIASDPAKRIMEIDGFNKTVDEFFSSIEGQKLESRLAEKEETAKRKMDNARQVQEKRIEGLHQVQAMNVRKAQAIEANLERVDEATAAVNGLIGQGKDWVEIAQLIGLEQRRKNQVADMIKLPLKLEENTITLLLPEWNETEEEDEAYQTGSESSESDSDSEVESRKPTKKAPPAADTRLAVEVDLSLSSWSNARQYYDQMKTAAAKEEKTVQASSKALKSAQRKIEADLKKSLKEEKATLQLTRQTYWFEKFIYFMSSDGYLVLGGRDAAQSETLYRKYLKKGDIFVHADLNGAVPFIIKNRPDTPDAPFPPSTLSQAGNMCVATSSAWDSKAVMSAWWAPSEIVKKVAPTGDVLGPGNFHIKGNKTFLPPAQLLLGFAVMFQISEASKSNHTKHRAHLSAAPTSTETASKDAADVDQETSKEDLSDNEEPDHTEDEAEEQDDGKEVEEQSDEDDEDDEEKDNARSNPLQSTSPTNDTLPSRPKEPSSTLEPSAPTQPDEQQEAHQASATDSEEESTDEDSAPSTAPAPSTTTSSSKPAPQVRGKRGKRKKMAQKYANQDEEDRAAAMELLGSRAGQERAAAEAAAKRARDDEAAAQKERRRQQALKAQDAARRKEEATTQAASLSEDEDDPTQDAVDIETLIGTPRPGDDLVAALPVCAPWAALGAYKYKVKLQPGSVKKGKAVREILGKLAADAAIKKNVDPSASDVERIWPREMELIKAWREEHAFAVVPVSKVRVMMAGAGGGAGKGGGKQRGGGGKKKR